MGKQETKITMSGTWDLRKLSELLIKYKNSSMNQTDCIFEMIDLMEDD